MCFFRSCVCYAFVRVCLYVPLWSPAGKGMTSWHSFVVSNCYWPFPIGILGQVWYLIVLVPDLFNLTYFHTKTYLIPWIFLIA